MCRAGGRRCQGSHTSSRATQTARKQRSRATQALRHAKATGDPDAIAAAQQRLDQANANYQAAKENTVQHHDNTDATGDTADHGGDVTEPKAAPAPITGELSTKPLLDNTWGDMRSENTVHYHDDGPIGTAITYMGPDARMDVDGEPLANVMGRTATDVVFRKTTAQQAVNDLKELRDRLPEGSRAKQCVSSAIEQMDGPDTPEPQVPDGTPEPLKDLVHKLHAVPMVRREPETEMQPLLDLCDKLAAGDRRTANRLEDQVQRLRNKRHESLGDSGKFEIDAAVKDAVTTLREQKHQQREQQQRAAADSGPTVHIENLSQHATNVGSQKAVNTDDTHIEWPAQDRDVTNIVHGEIRGQQHDVINGDVTIHSSGRMTISSRTPNDSYTQERARYQQERARYQQERARYRAQREARNNTQTGSDGDTVHTGRQDHTTGGTGPVHITDDKGNTFLQAGTVRGGIWVNGKRIG